MKIALMLFFAGLLYGQEPFSGAAAVDQQMERAVHDGLIPGGVVLIGHDGRVVYQKAYGSRALIPQREPMTLDTIFDAASLTKVIATTPAIMRLFEQGQIRLNDPVTKYLPEFQGGHSDITIRNLMTHFSGLRPDLDLKPAWSGYETGIQRALTDKPTGPPGVRFVYSDIDFILLGEIVHRLTGKTLDEYTRKNFYVGDVYKHMRGKTIFPSENTHITNMVMNTAAGHFNAHQMESMAFGGGKIVSFGGVNFSLVLGLSSQDGPERPRGTRPRQHPADQVGGPRRYALRLYGSPVEKATPTARMPASWCSGTMASISATSSIPRA